MYSNTLCKYYILIFLLTGGWILSTALCYPQSQYPSRQIVLRNGNQRTSRGFQVQNAKLSTARGFGKRGGGGGGGQGQVGHGVPIVGGNEIFISSPLELPSSSSASMDDYNILSEKVQPESTDSGYPSPPRNIYIGDPKRLQNWLNDELQAQNGGRSSEKTYATGMEQLIGRHFGVPG